MLLIDEGYYPWWWWWGCLLLLLLLLWWPLSREDFDNFGGCSILRNLANILAITFYSLFYYNLSSSILSLLLLWCDYSFYNYYILIFYLLNMLCPLPLLIDWLFVLINILFFGYCCYYSCFLIKLLLLLLLVLLLLLPNVNFNYFRLFFYTNLLDYAADINVMLFLLVVIGWISDSDGCCFNLEPLFVICILGCVFGLVVLVLLSIIFLFNDDGELLLWFFPNNILPYSSSSYFLTLLLSYYLLTSTSTSLHLLKSSLSSFCLIDCVLFNNTFIKLFLFSFLPVVSPTSYMSLSYSIVRILPLYKNYYLPFRKFYVFYVVLLQCFYKISILYAGFENNAMMLAGDFIS